MAIFTQTLALISDMIKCQPIIAVRSVEDSSKWYQTLLTCKSLHGGSTFEMLADQNNEVVLNLHKWGEHEHPTLTDSNMNSGNGLILYFTVLNLDSVWENALLLEAKIEETRHVNPNSGKEQFCVRDLDGYYLMISL